MNYIEERIEAHKQHLLAHGIEEKNILGIFLYGSQNYLCDTEGSDIDTKCIYIPTFKEAVLGKKRVKEYHLSNGEHCELMDIRHFIDNLKKQNINFVEVLYTKHCWINPLYWKLWHNCFEVNRESIAHYNRVKCIGNICGQAKHTIKQNPYDGKKMGNGYRLFYFLRLYADGREYEQCLIPTSVAREFIVNLKTSKLETDTMSKDLYNLFDYYEPIFLEEAEKVQDKELPAILDNIMDYAVIQSIKIYEGEAM